MTGSDGHAAARWCDVDRVVAAYAGTRFGLDAFTAACRALRRALPHAELSLLCPTDAGPPDGNGIDGVIYGVIDDVIDDVIEYPSPSRAPERDRDAFGATLRAVDGLAARGIGAALVFAERGIAPYAPAYLCYFAGIAYRAGFEAEFGGAVLSPSLRLPAHLDDGERHLALLAAVGLEPGRHDRPSRTSPTAVSTNRSLACDS